MPTKTKTAEAPAETPAVNDNTKEETVALEVVPQHAGAVTSLGDVQNLMMEDAQEDLGFGKDDVAIPFLRVLQSNSPQVKKQNAKYVVDAEAGMFYNTATNEIYSGDTGLYVVPVMFKRQATLWLPRDSNAQGGGFVAEIPLDFAEALLKNCHKSEKGKDLTPPMSADAVAKLNAGRIPPGFEKGPQECELVIAALYYVLIVNPDEPGMFVPVAFPLTSTQLKKSRTWNAMINNARLPNPNGIGAFRPAMYGFVYKLTTRPEQNAKGDWMGVQVIQHTPLIKYVNGAPTEVFPGGAQLYLAARDFKALVNEGKVTIKQDEPEVEFEGMPEGEGNDDNPPF